MSSKGAGGDTTRKNITLFKEKYNKRVLFCFGLKIFG